MSSSSGEQTPLSKLENGIFDVAPKTDWQRLTTERNAHKSPLLRLPRELRDLIWAFTFTRTVKPRQREGPLNSAFSPLVVCRQLYKEAASLAYPFLIWSFGCQPPWEDFFWTLCENEKHKCKKNLVRSIQIGVDSTDLYQLAEREDPGYDDDEEKAEIAKEDQDEYSRVTLRAFKNLSHLELLLSATEVYTDSDDIDDMKYDDTMPLRFDSTEINEAKENFTKTMSQKLSHVRVTYREFGNTSAMRKYWEEQDLQNRVSGR
ncbi:hypothetical protein G6011_07328 [Alternaria panax]|uniref:Uncharacterized protein n=1 Tax=Alternaria panax TaxID=48097 RepID=A0AAD4I7C1_9PLEO|nr:hypothetical protein G6011_07328 [Alternaria panax]